MFSWIVERWKWHFESLDLEGMRTRFFMVTVSGIFSTSGNNKYLWVKAHKKMSISRYSTVYNLIVIAVFKNWDMRIKICCPCLINKCADFLWLLAWCIAYSGSHFGATWFSLSTALEAFALLHSEHPSHVT